MPHPSQSQPKKGLSRRHFLALLGVGGGALALGVYVGLPAARLRVGQLITENDSQPAGDPPPPTAWFELLPDNRVRLHLSKTEMGQGAHTALAQIAAEDLGVAWEQLEVVQASTHRLNDAAGTGNSQSVRQLYGPLREAAATFREMLVRAAAAQWGVAATALTVAAGVVRAPTGASRTYAELAARMTEWTLPEDFIPTLKPVSDFKFIGQSLGRVDIPAKATGQAQFGYDVRLPNMHYGAVARPPQFGARIANVDASRAQTFAGVVNVVTADNFAGVVAKTRAQAQGAAFALNITWQGGQNLQQSAIDTLTRVRDGAGVVVQSEGQVQFGSNAIRAEYRTPMAAHAHLEPQAAVADVRPDKVVVYCSTQAPTLVRSDVARVLGRKEDEVEVHGTYLGGGFGRRLNVEVAVEAARLSQAAGVPVHVGWTREEDFRQSYVRPPTHHVLTGALENGRITHLEHQQASGDVLFSVFPWFVSDLIGADFGAYRGAVVRYDGIPNRRTRAERLQMPIKTSFWRGLGLLANIFAVESFMDELAHAAGQDSLAFRLAHLGDTPLNRRIRAVLTELGVHANWGRPPAGRAHGLAMCVDAGTVVGLVAEVSVTGNDWRVHHLTSVVDAGLVINPDGAAAQTEGGLLMGLSSVRHEALTIQDGQFVPSNFDQYPMLRHSEAPSITVKFIQGDDQPHGMGEPPIGPIGAAVANALFSLTGQRLRELPLRLQ